MNTANNEDVISAITIGYIFFKCEFYGLSQKIIKAHKNGFRFDEIVKSTMKTDSSPSNINICYYLNLPIPTVDRQFFKIVSSEPEFLMFFVMIEILNFISRVENG